MPWTTPADIRARLRKHWDRGTLLSARLTGENPFPLKISLAKPSSQDFSGNFEGVRNWIRELEEGSLAKLGYGYSIEWTEISHRQLGRNRIPASASIPSENDALRLLGKRSETERFAQLCQKTLTVFPQLQEWLTAKPHSALKHADCWDSILAVLDWFKHNPRSGLYLRQVDIPGVDTKFIERRKGLFSELLGLILTEPAGEKTPLGARHFEARFGLRTKPILMRFRFLDTSLFQANLSDISSPLNEFGSLNPPCRNVFITENEINGLAFPSLPDSMVLFGLGYGVDCLAHIPWLREKRLFYWGDIDTHGFSILNRLRSIYPETRSFLMDKETFLTHKSLWVEEASPFKGTLPRLLPEESAVFSDLSGNVSGYHVRLEQERISFGWVVEHVHRLLS